MSGVREGRVWLSTNSTKEIDGYGRILCLGGAVTTPRMD